MKKIFLTLLIVLLSASYAISQNREIKIIPEPVDIKPGKGSFTLNSGTVVVTEGKDTRLADIRQWFVQRLSVSTGLKLKSSVKAEKNALVLSLLQQADKTLGDEGYYLEVSPSLVKIKANKPAGIFYGLQTLLQLLPPEVYSQTPVSGVIWTVPAVQITDYPRFGWRGILLDVSRHFFSKEDVFHFIDEIALYKYNLLHLHLTDDNGWRLEIKSLPKLTQFGAWRVERTGRWGTFTPPLVYEPTTYGGFYTQDDMKEIIAYASTRFVNILPEIDVPAHSLALIASYPNLSCTKKQYPVSPGARTEEIQDNVLCVGNDSVFMVLDKIFTEVAELFPFEYIHIGGDEAYKGFWETCPLCRRRMDEEHLKNVEELQSYFVKRIEKILKAKGKKLIGWDEILEGGLAPEATVMSWRGMQGGIEAARMNHHVVMTPWAYCYLDLYQGDPLIEPPTYGSSRLSIAYSFEPVPDSIDPKYILGGQGNLWTESVPTLRHAEYMVWPRAMALSEVYWSPKSRRNWDVFVSKMESHFSRLDAAGINYSRSAYDPIISPRWKTWGHIVVTLSSEIPGLDIYYTFDDTYPDQHSLKYDGKELSFPMGAGHLNVITYRNGKPIGRMIRISKEQLEERVRGN